MEILLVLTVGAMCIGCFVVGAKVGQQVSRGETVNIPLPNPANVIRQRTARNEADRERNRLGTIMENIERYDGYPGGQVDIPK